MKRLSVMVMVMAAACGGGSGGGLSPRAITPEEAQPLCEADCQHDIDCGTEVGDVPLCTSNCVDDVAGWARGDAVEALYECSSVLACGAADSSCLLEIQPLAIHQEWEDRCRTTLVTCLDPTEIDGACEVTPSAADEELGFFRFIAPEIMPELINCLDGADCAARFGCVEAAFTAHGIEG